MITRHERVGLQRQAPKRTGWTLARRTAFLDELARSANVTRAVASVGMSATGARKLRRRDPEFAMLWAKAVAEGAQRLEEEVLAHSLAQLPSEDNPDDVRDPTPLIEFDARAAMEFLKWRAGQGRAPSAAAPLSPEAVDAALMERFEALSKRLSPS